MIVPVSLNNAPHAVQLGMEVHAMSSLRHIPFDWGYSLACMCEAVRDPSWHIEMSYVDGAYTGLMIGRVIPFTFSPALFGDEVLWYVRQGSQERTRFAASLMRRFVKWAIEDKGAIRVQTGDIANIDTLAVDAIYRHLGFTRYGVIYKYEKGASDVDADADA